MTQTKWERRDKKREKRRSGMRISGRSVLLLDEIIKEKSRKVTRDRERKSRRKEDGRE